MTPYEFTTARKCLGMSQTAMAKALGCSLRRVQNLEDGTAPIRRETVYALAWVTMHRDRAEPMADCLLR